MDFVGLPVIACAHIPQALVAGKKLSSANGCAIVGGGAGEKEITLDEPFDQMSEDRLLVLCTPSFGTGAAKTSFGLSSISTGTLGRPAFFINSFIDGTLTDLSFTMVIFLRPKQ